MPNWLDKYRDTTNPYWPLPRDYNDLSAEGKKQARLSVVTNHSTPLNWVIAWNFFRTIYLAQAKNVMFYKNGFQDSPAFHFDLVHDMGMYGRNAIAAPRGFAKSTLIAVETNLLLAITRPFYETIVALATDKLVEERFDQLILQIEQNELIREDFGELKPKRGQALFNHHHMTLTNGSVIKGLSVMGRKRGGRPRCFILDDP